MMNKSWRKGLVALAVTTALSVATTAAYAAGESSSGIIGSADGCAGCTVSVKNPQTGLSREVTADSSGSFRFSQLPVGEYEVVVTRDGTIVAKETVRVALGANAVARFDVSSRAGAEVVEVVGSRPSAVDISAADTGLVVGEAELDKLPVARNLTSVALLAPGTVQGEARFGNLASFGGSSVAENSCYINGLEVTDTRQGLGCGSVPFEFYKEFQVKTGGYSAQFGRTTGGVINAVTKSGTNEWEFAFTANLRPSSLAEEGRVSRATGATGANVNRVFRDFSQDETDFKEFTLSAAGPIIQDKLFIYALVNPRYVDDQFSSVSGNASRTATNRMNFDKIDGMDNAFWGTKIDWEISDNHRLSAFGYSDKRDVEREVYTYNPDTGVLGDHPQQLTLQRGGEAMSVNYVGYLTDSITLSAMVGKIDTDFFNEPSNTTCPNVTDSRGVPTNQQAPNCFVGNDGTNFDENEQQRLDVEWVLGDHLIRAGLDYQDRQSENTTIPSGGAAYDYLRLTDGASIQIQGGNTFTNNTGADLDVVAVRVFEGGGGFDTDMKAYYIEDQWSVTPTLTLTVGVRQDALTNYGTTGIAFADFKETAPRLGASWDPTGDGTSKVFGTWGRYFLPIPNNTNFRMASGVADATTYYRFAGATATFDSIGAPTGITPVNGTVEDSTNTNSLPVFPDRTMSQAKEAKPFYKDELIIGYETEMSEEYKASVRYIFREVASALDDYCGDLAPACVLLNPGEGGTWGEDNDGDGHADPGTYVYHSAEEIGLPKAKNEYTGVQFQLDRRSADTTWSFIYTWSRSYGNFEGAVKSDIAQADAGITQDFDFPALMDGSDGYQPNDRRHVFKFFGSHALTDQLSVGWNATLASGRPLSTFGRGYPSSDDHIYGSYGDTFYLYTGICPDANSNGTCEAEEKQYVRTERGDAGRTPWTFNLNASLDYDFEFSGVEMRASMDVFNLLNSQEITASNEHYESSEGTRNQYYGSAYTYQQPRYVQFGIEARF